MIAIALFAIMHMVVSVSVHWVISALEVAVLGAL